VARHLRILYFESNGKQANHEPLSSARLPGFIVPATKMPASVYVRSGAESRRSGAAATLLAEMAKKHPTFAGVAFISCPSISKKLSNKQAYLASFVAVSRDGEVTRGDAAAETYKSVRRMIGSRMREIILSRGRKAVRRDQ
jgi:hypothetical protein